MKARGAAIHGALAVAGLVAAYFTWQRTPESAQGEVVVVDATKNSLQKIRLQDGTKWLELTRSTESGEPSYWVKASPPEPVKLPGPDGGTLAASMPEPGPPKELRGSDCADKEWEKFTPLRAVRGLGVLPADKRKELGLDGSTKALELTVDGHPEKFMIGTPAGGLGTPYAENVSDHKVYLISAATLNGSTPARNSLSTGGSTPSSRMSSMR